MEISDRDRQDCKRELLAFLENDVGRMYMDDIKTMMNYKRRRLVVDISDLHSFGNLSSKILRRLGDYMQPLADIVTDLVGRIDGKYLKEGETINVGFQGRLFLGERRPENFFPSLLAPWSVSRELSPNESYIKEALGSPLRPSSLMPSDAVILGEESFSSTASMSIAIRLARHVLTFNSEAVVALYQGFSLSLCPLKTVSSRTERGPCMASLSRVNANDASLGSLFDFHPSRSRFYKSRISSEL